MGRPRKRPRDETSNESPAEAQATQNTTTNSPPDTVDAGRFINLLSGGEVNYDALEGSQEKGYPWSFGYTGDSLGDIGFDPVPEHAPLFSASHIDPSLFISTAAADTMVIDPPSVEQLPNLSPNSASTPESVGSSYGAPQQPPTPPAVGCAHTAALYLALDAMQTVPADVEDAMRHARRATKTAYDVVYCPVCSFQIEPPENAAGADVMRNFQNLMLLAALVPSIVHAYERILRAIDEEAGRAAAERRRLVFKLPRLGGILWGSADGQDCGAADVFNHREMEPAMWRLTVRALLKADVYGLSGMDSEFSDNSPLHIGLKDIVLQMEQKSKARHALMDVLVRSGAWRPPNCGMKIHEEGETPTCQKVIAIAKASIDQLVIA